jgi:hypothetical protein
MTTCKEEERLPRTILEWYPPGRRKKGSTWRKKKKKKKRKPSKFVDAGSNNWNDREGN